MCFDTKTNTQAVYVILIRILGTSVKHRKKSFDNFAKNMTQFSMFALQHFFLVMAALQFAGCSTIQLE